MKFTSCFVGAFLVLTLSACSSFEMESKKIDYKSASTAKVPSLEIPPDLTSPTQDDRFIVPDAGGKGVATFSTYSNERVPERQAAQSTVLPEVEKARIERSGNQRWLVVAETPDKLWGVVKDFWQETGFLIKIERPEAGVMETDWAENRAKIQDDFLRNLLGKVIDSLYSTAERDKFRTRMEPGTLTGTTDIFISHRGMQELYVSEGKEQTKWQPREADPELEAEMLRRMMVYLGADQKRAEIQVQAAREKPAEQARIAQDAAGTLEVLETFDRAWRRVGLALDRIGFTVEDRDRSLGIYYVRYVDPEADDQKNEGFLSKLAFWKDSGQAQPTRFRIHVKGEGSIARVQVLSPEGAEGKASQSETAKRILRLLLDQLK
ncbi:MAG: outer membrane protein assembly factor BamC [Candidatus Accumulibacter sp.]|jgi:outer membrane protein assembly factor BamC|nr:outer membrane protein assembly factor BamC [Accumulibacter sp.]